MHRVDHEQNHHQAAGTRLHLILISSPFPCLLFIHNPYILPLLMNHRHIIHNVESTHPNWKIIIDQVRHCHQATASCYYLQILISPSKVSYLISCSYRGWLLIILHDCIYNWAMHVHMLSLPLGAHPNCIIRACPSVVLSGFSHGKWVFGPKEQACRVSRTLRTGSGVRFYLSWSIRCENLQSFDLLANGDMVWHPAKYLCCVLT